MKATRPTTRSPFYIVEYRQAPTFFLHRDVQGIVSDEHARRVAALILGVDPSTPGIVVAQCESEFGQLD